jgi:ubiquinone/menaquinone biosynthesis C-methylase UbiE
MSGSLDYTGERFTPECVREIWYEHFHRYVFALNWCSGAQVLDAACGEGYGSDLLALQAESVIAVDLSAETIAHAQARYGARKNLQFQVADCTALPFADDSFDRVVSFETLEHLEDHESLMTEFRRVLKPDGCLLLSTPDKAVYSDGQDSDNPFHVRELYRDEFESLISRWFPSTRLFGQKLVFASAIWQLDEIRTVSLSRHQDKSVTRLNQFAREPMYFIALCAADETHLPVMETDLWLFDDADESVYTHYHGEIRRNMKAGGLLLERDREIDDLRLQLAKRGEQVPFWRRWFGKG